MLSESQPLAHMAILVSLIQVYAFIAERKWGSAYAALAMLEKQIGEVGI